MNPLWLPPIDATGAPSLWMYQDLQAWEPFQRTWVIEPTANARNYPTRRTWRGGFNEAGLWDPYREYAEMQRGYMRARYLYWSDRGTWHEWRTVESRR